MVPPEQTTTIRTQREDTPDVPGMTRTNCYGAARANFCGSCIWDTDSRCNTETFRSCYAKSVGGAK